MTARGVRRHSTSFGDDTGSIRPYRGLLATSFLSRIPLGMAGIGLLTLALASGLGPGVGGTAVGVYAACFALAGPIWGRAVQRLGPYRVLKTCWVGQVSASLAVATLQSQPWGYLLASALLGVTTPPLAAIMRATWNHLFSTHDRLADRLSVFETMNTEAVHVVGRLLVAALAAAGAFLVPWIYATIMTIGLALLTRDGRLVNPVMAAKRGRSTWNGTNLVWGLVMLLMAVSHGGAATAMVVSGSPSGDWRGPLTMVVWALGSIAGGALTLTRPNLASPVRTAMVGQVCFAAVAVMLAHTFGDAGWTPWLLLLALGAPITPTISAVFRASKTVTRTADQVRQFALFNSLNFLGFSIGSAAAGWTMDLLSRPGSGFLLAALSACAALLPLAFQ